MAKVLIEKQAVMQEAQRLYSEASALLDDWSLSERLHEFIEPLVTAAFLFEGNSISSATLFALGAAIAYHAYILGSGDTLAALGKNRKESE